MSNLTDTIYIHRRNEWRIFFASLGVVLSFLFVVGLLYYFYHYSGGFLFYVVPILISVFITALWAFIGVYLSANDWFRSIDFYVNVAESMPGGESKAYGVRVRNDSKHPIEDLEISTTIYDVVIGIQPVSEFGEPFYYESDQRERKRYERIRIETTIDEPKRAFSEKRTIYPNSEDFLFFIHERPKGIFFGNADVKQTGFLDEIYVEDKKTYEGWIKVNFLRGYSQFSFSYTICGNKIGKICFDSDSTEIFIY